VETRQLLQEIAFNMPSAPFPESDSYQQMVLDFAGSVRQVYEEQLLDGDPVVSAMDKLDDMLRQRGILQYGNEWLVRFVNEVAEEAGFEVPWEDYELPT
jgi:hypothetical protein